MNGKARTLRSILLIAGALMSVAFLVFVFFFPPLTLETEDFGTPRVLNKWYAVVARAPYGSVSIPNNLIPAKQLSLYLTLPRISDGEYVSLQTANHRVRMYVDKQLIYEFGFNGNELQPIPTMMYEHLVELKPEYFGKRLEIALYPVYFPASRLTKSVLMGTPLQIQLYNITSMRISDNIGYVLAAFGFFILLYGLYDWITSREKDSSMLLLGCVYILLGCKISMQVCLMTSLVTNPYTSFYLFWFSLTDVTMLLSVLLGRMMPGYFRGFFTRATYIYAGFFTLSLLLVLLDIELYSILMTLFYVAHLVMLISLLLRSIRMGIKATLPMLLLVALLGTDVLNHYLQFIPADFLAYNTLWLTYTTLYMTYMILSSRMRSAYARQYEYDAMLMKNSALLQSITEIEQYTARIERLRHDIKKHLYLVDSFIASQDTKKAHEYIQSITGDIEAHSFSVTCPNHIVSAIVQNKLQQAEQRDVALTYELRLSAELNINDMDVCSVFANCLDNALEACSYVKTERYIRLASYIKNGHLFLRVENSAPETAPPKQKGRGLGLKIINEIVDKYNGMVNIERAKDRFVIELALKCADVEHS